MPISRPEAEALAALVHTLRPSWNTAGILATLKECRHRPEPPEVIAQAMLRCTMDREEARTPAALIARPSYWNLEQPLDTPHNRLTPEHECPRHVGQWADKCSPCAGERIGTDHGGELPDPPTDFDPSAATIGDYYRREARIAAARAAERFAELHPAKPTGEVIHVVTDVPASTTPNQGEHA